MSRRKTNPLRPLTDEEVALLTKLSRSQSESATRVARASLILAVARGCDYQQAAESIGRRSGDAVSHLVARFNTEGLAALDLRGEGSAADGRRSGIRHAGLLSDNFKIGPLTGWIGVFMLHPTWSDRRCEAA